MEVALRVQDPSGSVTRDVVVQSQEANTVGDLVEVLVDVLEWPREGFAGEPLSYSVRRLGAAAALDRQALVAGLGLKQGEAIIIGPSPSR